MQYVLYARKSSEEKTRQAQSIDDQIAALQPLIEREGYDVAHILTESKSAKAPGRPVFSQMLDLIQKGKADGILCWHLNRLTRNEIDSGTIRWMLRQGMIREIVTPHRTYRPEDNALITAVESAMGEQFIVELTASSRRGMLSKVEKGWFPGRVPQGYKNDVAAHTIVPDPERWELMRRAWGEMLTGGVTVPQLADRMTRDWGYRSPGGGSRGMPRTTLYRLMINPFYAGLFVFEGRLHTGKHEPMVSMAEWEAVQTRLKRVDGKASRRLQKHTFAYSGMITCGQCGATVCADRKRKIIKATGEEKFFTYYACGKGSRCKGSGRIREDRLEDAIAAQLAAIEMPQEYLDYARGVVCEVRDEEEQAEKAVRASQARALADTEQQINELLTLRIRALIDDGEYRKRKEQLGKERDAILLNAKKTSEAMERSWATTEAVSEFCVVAAQNYAEAGVVEKGAIARKLGAKYVLRKGVVEIELHDLLGLVREHKNKAHSHYDALEPLESGSGSKEGAGCDPVCLDWGDLVNAIRTKAYKEAVVFLL